MALTCSSALDRESDQVRNNCSFSEPLFAFPEIPGPGAQAVVLVDSMKQQDSPIFLAHPLNPSLAQLKGCLTFYCIALAFSDILESINSVSGR